MSSLGEDLPPEIIREIIAHFVNSTPSVSSKPGLASCSITCRYWASVIRPALFASISLSSRYDLLQLLEFLQSHAVTTQTISECLECISIVQRSDYPAPPWFHHVDIIRRVSKRSDLAFTLMVLPGPTVLASAGPPSVKSDAVTFPSPVFCLPRRLPSCITPFQMMRLSDIEVSRKDFLRLLGSLPGLWSLHCRRVSFKDDMRSSGLSYGRPNSVLKHLCLDGYEFRTATGNLWTQLLLASTILRGSRHLNVEQQVWLSALGAVCSLLDHWGPGVGTLTVLLLDNFKSISGGTQACRLDISHRRTLADGRDDPAAGYTAYMIHLEFEQPDRHPHLPEPPMYLARFNFSMPYNESLSRLRWDAFEDKISQLDPIPAVVVHAAPDQFMSAECTGFFDALLRQTILQRTTEADRLSVTASSFPFKSLLVSAAEIRRCIDTVPVDQRLPSLCAALENSDRPESYDLPFGFRGESKPLVFTFVEEQMTKEK